jgi:integrase
LNQLSKTINIDIGVCVLPMKKRKDGRYQRAITINGKKKFFYGKSPAEVNKKILAYNAELERTEKEKYLFSNLVQEWFEQHSNEIAYNTKLFYRKPVEDVKEYFQGYYIQDIKPKNIIKYLDYLSKCSYKSRTVSARLVVIRLTFEYAIINEIVETNPAKSVKLPKSLVTTTRNGLSDEEIKTVINSKNIFLNTLLFTGLRRNEALALHWEDIDFQKNIINVNKALLWGDNGPQIITKLKTEKSIATLPLLEPLRELLEPIRKNRGLIFTNKKGNIYTAGSFWRMWVDLKNKYNLSCCPHQFRHAYITILHDSGVDVKTAQILARHSRIQTTLDIYTHLDENAIENAREKINIYLTGSQ